MLALHQSDAVARIRERLNVIGGVLLADDVGLGKSFVAAEVMRRFEGTVELIVPAALVAQWRETLQRFDVVATLMTHDGIVTAPFVPSPERRLVVVDEAHAFRNPQTHRYAALARRTIAARVLLVTATPVCNSVEDLQVLLRLFCRDDVLLSAGVPSIDAAFEERDDEALLRIVAELVIRRGRAVLPELLRFGELDRRVIVHDIPSIPELDTLQFPLVGEPSMLRRFLRRRLESSEAALLESVQRQLRFYERALSAVSAGRTLPKRDYRNAFAAADEHDAFQEVLFWEFFAPVGRGDPVLIREEMQRLEAIRAAAVASPCTKRQQLVELLCSVQEPALIFTGSAATGRDLQRVLRCALVTSRERSRDAVLDAFSRGRIDVVVSTDLAAEGLNLQRAGVVVHYDIPWNPVKLDQRNGRAWRIGQTRERVRAVYFLPRSRETRILQIVARKNRVRRQLLDGSSAASSGLGTSTLRPRLPSDSAFVQLSRRHPLPSALARRHKAGIEQLMQEMASEYLDQRRIDDLLALVAMEV
jgi:superfamily II DNA or RNA helicase